MMHAPAAEEGGQASGQASGHAEAMMAFVLGLRTRGLTDQRVLNAVSTLPRPLFVLPDHAGLAWRDLALPIQCGQVVTPPHLVATIAERLEIAPEHRVLEIGTGSGYLTAVLARLARRVLTLDRWRTLIAEAEARLRAVSILNVTMMVADGGEGWPGEAPFDRIVSTAAVETIPPAWLDQLAPGGRLVAPVGPAGGPQSLMLVQNDEEGMLAAPLASVRMAPLIPGIARHL